MTQALVHLDEFETSWSELKKLPKEHLAAIGVLSYAVSETNALARIYLCQSHDYTEQKPLDSISNIHRFLIIRTWSAKLFEAIEFLRFGGRKSKTSDLQLLSLSKTAIKKFDGLKQASGYSIARDIRNEAANHYSFEAAQKNIDSVHASADCNLYLHDVGGNCFYPFGEELMFHARLNRKWKNVSTKVEKDALFNEWLDWNLAANKCLDETHADFTNELVFRGLSRNQFRPKKYWAPMSYVGDVSERKTPLFLRRPDK